MHGRNLILFSNYLSNNYFYFSFLHLNPLSLWLILFYSRSIDKISSKLFMIMKEKEWSRQTSIKTKKRKMIFSLTWKMSGIPTLKIRTNSMKPSGPVNFLANREKPLLSSSTTEIFSVKSFAMKMCSTSSSKGSHQMSTVQTKFTQRERWMLQNFGVKENWKRF